MNSPAKSVMLGIPVPQNPALTTPITMVTNTIPAKSQIVPPMNLSNNSNSSIPALLDPTKLPVSDSPKASSSNSVTPINSSPTISPSKTNSNISHDTKPSSNDLSNSTPLTITSNVDVQNVGKDPVTNSNVNGNKATTNGIDTSARELPTKIPEEKIFPSTKDHEEDVKVPVSTDSKPITTESSEKTTPVPTEPIAPTPANLVSPTKTADTTNSTAEPIVSPGSKAPGPITAQVEPIVEKSTPSSTPIEKEKPQSIKSPKSPAKEVIPAKEDVQEKITSKSDVKSPPAPAVESSPVKVSEETLKTPTTPKKQTKVTPKRKESDTKADKNASDSEVGKPKRARLPVQPFQSPLPELTLVTRLINKSKTEKVEEKEKLVIFYKNEFLAVRNEDGGFYVCQALQNVFKSSHRIRIRWLSQGPNNEFTPDFYDATEFDCILTCLKLTKIDKEKWKLTEQEKERVENILKRSLEVEKGEAIPALTEEHPDGLDLSLFRDESQLRKSSKTSKKSSKKSPVKKAQTPTASTTSIKKNETPVTSGTNAAKRSLNRPKRVGAKISYDFDEPSSSGSDFSVKTATKKGVAAKVAKTPVPPKKVASTPDIVAAKKKAATKTPVAKTPTANKTPAANKTPVANKTPAANKTLAANKTPAAKKTPATQDNKTPAVSKTKLATTTPPPDTNPTSSRKQASKRKATDKTPVTSAAKVQKEEAPPKPKPTISTERSTKARNAGSAVEAKITSAVTPSRPSRERRSGGTTKK